MITSALENDNVNYKHVFPCSTVVENPLASAGDTEMRVSSLGREDPLEQGIATVPVFLPGKFQGQRSLVSHKELDRLSMHTYI